MVRPSAKPSGPSSANSCLADPGTCKAAQSKSRRNLRKIINGNHHLEAPPTRDTDNKNDYQKYENNFTCAGNLINV